MADWSRLPPELVVLIAKHLTTRFDILRFRSVCPSWRSSVPPKVDPLPTPLPSKKQGRYERSQINFVRNTFYLVRSCHGGQTETPACWFVKIRDTTDRVQLQLVYPSFWDFMWNPRPENFPKVIDLTRFQVFELGHEYLVNYNVDVDHSLEPRHEYFEDKVVFLRTHTGSHTGFIMFILRGCTLSFLRSGDKEWACLQDLHDVQDIISFNGKVYAIARGGRTIIIDPTLKVSFFEHGVGSSSTTKFLVESVDDLLAVEKLSNPANSESPVRFRVFRMNEEEQKWDEMGSLRDQILFLVSEQAISAPASDFGWGKGNLIFYSRGLSNTLPYGNPKDRLMLVFDLETGTTTNILENCPGHRNLLFWPPPQWITCPESSISHHTSYSTHLTTSETIEEEEEEEVDGARRSPSSKCNFKFCCF